MALMEHRSLILVFVTKYGKRYYAEALEGLKTILAKYVETSNLSRSRGNGQAYQNAARTHTNRSPRLEERGFADHG